MAKPEAVKPASRILNPNMMAAHFRRHDVFPRPRSVAPGKDIGRSANGEVHALGVTSL